MLVSSDLDSDGWILKLVWLGKLKEEEDEDNREELQRLVGRDKKGFAKKGIRLNRIQLGLSLWVKTTGQAIYPLTQLINLCI